MGYNLGSTPNSPVENEGLGFGIRDSPVKCNNPGGDWNPGWGVDGKPISLPYHYALGSIGSIWEAYGECFVASILGSHG